MLTCPFIQAESVHLQSGQEWIVLPDLVNPYTSPSLNAEKSDIVFKYLEQIKEIEKPEDVPLSSQEWVAKPGHSEHQLGTTVDLSNPDPRSMGHQSFGSSQEGQWLQEHAEEFGFKQSYTQDNIRFTGYQSEPWHYRYFGIQ